MRGAENEAMLFDLEGWEEWVTVTCRVFPGGFAVERVHGGELTWFCLGETPYVEGVMVGRRAAAPLLEFFGIESMGQLVEVLRVMCAGEDALERVIDLLEATGVPYASMSGGVAC